MSWDTLVSRNFPTVSAHAKIEDCLERLRSYSEAYIPVLGEKRRVIGVITTDDIVEAVDHAMGDDYAKLGGLSGEEDLHEPLKTSLKKRMPWLIILLFLGMGVSSVVGLFESVVSQIALIVCFQSLILDMAGNVGTQSLAVTIRVLMDENLKPKQKFELILKEMRIGFSGGILLGLACFRVHRAVRLAAQGEDALLCALHLRLRGRRAVGFDDALQSCRHCHSDDFQKNPR